MSEPPEFPSFPKLPAEIRVMIWKHASVATQTPRIVQLECVQTSNKISVPKFPFTSNSVKILNPGTIPSAPLLQVCEESRIEMQKMPKMFSMTAPGIQFDGVFFNPEVDVLMVDMPTAYLLAIHGPENDLLELRYVAIYDEVVQFTHWGGDGEEVEFLSQDGSIGLMELYEKLVAKQKFSKLQWLHIILNDDIPGDPPQDWDLEDLKREMKDWQYEMDCGLPDYVFNNTGWFVVDDTNNEVSPNLRDGTKCDQETVDLWTSSGMVTRGYLEVKYFSELMAEMGLS